MQTLPLGMKDTQNLSFYFLQMLINLQLSQIKSWKINDLNVVSLNFFLNFWFPKVTLIMLSGNIQVQSCKIILTFMLVAH